MPVADSPIELTVDHVERGDCTTRVTRVDADGDVADPHTFVLVAGIGVAATYFEFLAPTLARKGHVYALDLPGFGGMPRPNEQPDAAFFADQVEAVLDHYGIADPVLIGHSMGTQIVTEVLVRRPGTSHAVLVSPVIDDSYPSAWSQGLRFVQSASRESLHLSMTALSAYVLCGLVYFLTVLPSLLRYRIIDRVTRVRSHVLFIRGEYDTTSPRRFHSRLARAVPTSSQWEIEGAAHSIINGHAVGVALLTGRLLDGTLARKGRMPSEEAETPPAPHADVAFVLGAVRARMAEWFSALRGDERGVARAKTEHARILWRAYSPGNRT